MILDFSELLRLVCSLSLRYTYGDRASEGPTISEVGVIALDSLKVPLKMLYNNYGKGPTGARPT